jgi:hypothetical protein
MRDRHGPFPDSYWVVPGRLLAGEYPGSARDDRASAKFKLFHEAGVDCFVDLPEQGEYALDPYAERPGRVVPVQVTRARVGGSQNSQNSSRSHFDRIEAFKR